MELEHHLAWFAKYEPQRLIQLASSFRLGALDIREIGPALNFANQLPYSAETVQAKFLLAKAKECSERESKGSEQRFYWSLLQLHVLAFTCFGEAELKDWLVFASERCPLRREIHFYPIPILCPLSLPNTLATFARAQARRCCNDSPSASDMDASEAEFDFWAYIGGLAGEPDLDFHKWVDEQIRQRQPAGNRRHQWLLLWFRSAPTTALEEAVATGSILEFLGKDGLRPLASAGRWRDDWTRLGADFDSLIEHLPIGEVGTLLANANRDSDLARWGHLVFKNAHEIVGDPPFDRQFWGTTIHTIDRRGHIIASGCDREEGSQNENSEGLRPKGENLSDLFNPKQSHDDLERKANEGIRIWREDQDRLRKIEYGALDRFGAANALQVWRDRHKDSFLKYATELLGRAAHEPSKAFHIGGFIACVIDALVPLAPDLAMKMDTALRGSSLRVNIINEYGVATFLAAFWHSASEGNRRCQEICRSFIEASNTDEELMSHAITAQAEGADEVLKAISESLVSDPLAKNRCLAVSLLAWVPSEAEIRKLEQLAVNDPSGWVRTHAEWAVEVAKHEASVRRHYALTLKEKDRNMILARLQVLLPALTPSARWWHRDLERQSDVLEGAAPDIRAALVFFWYDSKSECKKAPELFGRKVGEYFRGERIKDLRSPIPRLTD